jgi:hypothetical protein
MSSIQAYRPKTVAIEAVFAETPPGAAFIENVERLMRGATSILLLVEHDDQWLTTPHGSSRGRAQAPAAAGKEPGSRIVAPSAQAVAATATATIAAAAARSAPAVNTRRAPRFLVRDKLEVVAESGPASLIDMSVLGAQIVSLPVLRPNQKLKLDLTDPSETLSVSAHVAWSMFEKPQPQAEPYYRVGLEFSGAAQQALEQYRQRHCSAQPMPLRVR